MTEDRKPCWACGVPVIVVKDPMTNRWRVFEQRGGRPHRCPGGAKKDKSKANRVRRYRKQRKRGRGPG